MSYLETGILLGVLIVCLHILGTAIWYGIGPMPSSSLARATIREMLPQEAKRICVLGSGWGSLAMDASQTIRDAHVTGIEISFFPWLFSRLWSSLRRADNLTLRWKNFHSVSLAEYDLILCYIHRDGMKALQPKLEAELRDGAYLLSNTFAVYGWNPIRVEKLRDVWKTRVILYRFKQAPAPNP
ncbi:MAG: SAM-dependent methyltransferase [Myxococcota bacterium]|nr:SAM-dependent methyltransferase [Myxococcota bacterium]